MPFTHLKPTNAILSAIAVLGAISGLVFNFDSANTSDPSLFMSICAAAAVLIASMNLLGRLPKLISLIALFLTAHILIAQLLVLSGSNFTASAGFWSLAFSSWALAWLFVDSLAQFNSASSKLQRIIDLAIPVVFGIWILLIWQLLVRGFNISPVLLPPPSEIGIRISTSLPILWADFKQTFLKAVLIGYILGCGSGFIISILIDRIPFLQRGLLPIGNFVSALPIIGIAPIMVMWFGFDWQSKAAVVIVMTFFPMLVNTTTGLAAADRMQIDLMHTYCATYWHSLLKLRLPVAMPFIFNALKINSTLALIGAIVAEFFGTPIVGMGFRISTEVGRMNIDMVWAEIAVAALAGSLFYGFIALLEKSVTFWHPSMRKC